MTNMDETEVTMSENVKTG